MCKSLLNNLAHYENSLNGVFLELSLLFLFILLLTCDFGALFLKFMELMLKLSPVLLVYPLFGVFHRVLDGPYHFQFSSSEQILDSSHNHILSVRFGRSSYVCFSARLRLS